MKYDVRIWSAIALTLKGTTDGSLQTLDTIVISGKYGLKPSRIPL